jgi:NAD(P)-dependent dehydrogenase (short-subunit alcohol dehydrogenase family)
MKLQNKVAVITGGNSGIGLATARVFGANGARVVIFGRSRRTLDQAAESLGGDALPVQGDVRNLDDLERLFEQTAQRFGKIDVLVANAGIAKFAPVEILSEALFDESVWGFDPDEVMKAQRFVPREPDGFESAYEADEERAARIPPDINSQIYELRRMFRL